MENKDKNTESSIVGFGIAIGAFIFVYISFYFIAHIILLINNLK